MSAYLFALTTLFLSFNLPAFSKNSSPNARQHAIAMHNDIKYPPNFPYFEGVNPQAPKGGILKIGGIGTFDSTNPFITKGTPPIGLSLFSEKLVFETLMYRAPDEPFTLYPLIAESIEVAPNRSWIIFHLNPKATWADGRPITAKDILFSYETLRDKGRPNFRMYYSRVATAQILGEWSIKFSFKPLEDGSFDPELPLLLGLMSILPKHFFDGKDFEKTSLDFLLGSGPYRVAEVKPGHKIIYERRPDYWGKELPCNVGLYNFDRIEVTYYRDPHVARMAFAAGEFDFYHESDPGSWKNSYDFKAVKEGKVKKVSFTHKHPAGMHAYCMNTRRDIFKDSKVRQALTYVFNGLWINKNFFHNSYQRNRSFFDNCEFAHQGIPSPEELTLLDPYRKEIPTEVFEKPYYPPNYFPKENFRHNKLKALELLKEAGWIVQKGHLQHQGTGKPFTFELLLYNKDDEKIALAFAKDLADLGIKMTIRTIDSAQFETRRLKFDYDMIVQYWGITRSPGNEQTYYWSSAAAEEEGSRNYAGVKNPAVDFLCKRVGTARNRSELITTLHALDRILLWNHYGIPLYYNNITHIAHWEKLDHPPLSPESPIRLMSWWIKKD